MAKITTLALVDISWSLMSRHLHMVTHQAEPTAFSISNQNFYIGGGKGEGGNPNHHKVKSWLKGLVTTQTKSNIT